MGNTSSYKANYNGKDYEGVGLEELFKSVARNNRTKYAGNSAPVFLQVTGAAKYVNRIVEKTKKLEVTLKNNNVPADQIAGKLVQFMIEELDRTVNEESYSNFGKKKINGMVMFGNTTSLSQMSGPFGGSRFGSSCGSTAAFGRRHRKNSKKSKKRKSSFGKGKKGKKGKKSRKSRKARA